MNIKKRSIREFNFFQKWFILLQILVQNFSKFSKGKIQKIPAKFLSYLIEFALNFMLYVLCLIIWCETFTLQELNRNSS